MNFTTRMIISQFTHKKPLDPFFFSLLATRIPLVRGF